MVKIGYPQFEGCMQNGLQKLQKLKKMIALQGNKQDCRTFITLQTTPRTFGCNVAIFPLARRVYGAVNPRLIPYTSPPLVPDYPNTRLFN
jgi:hypothetical protein